MNSLRTRLLAGIMGSIALLLALFGILIYAAIHRALSKEFDAAMMSSARTLAACAEVEDEGIEIDYDPEMIPELRHPGLPSCFQFWSEDGGVLLRSDSLGETNLPRFHGRDSAPAWRDVALPGGESGRALGIRFAPVDNNEYFVPADKSVGRRRTAKAAFVTLVMAKSRRPLDEQLAFFGRLLAGAGAVTMLAALVVSLWLVRRGLRPLNVLADRIAAIREDELSVHMPREEAPTELLPVVERLEDLLHRLGDAFNRERSFAANVAHELRTPLSGAASTIEVALSRERLPAEYVEALNDALQIVRRMHAMVERLLLLGRWESGQVALHKETIPLAEAVAACWETVAERAGERGLSFENRVPKRLAWVADFESIIMGFTNLLDNAAQYAEEKGRIWVTGKEVGDSVEIAIANTGCTLTEEQAARIFEPFWRADASRTAAGGHCGLGLAVVQRIIQTLGGSIAAEVEDGGVFVARIRLPAKVGNPD